MKTCKECIHYTPCWKETSVAVRQHTERQEIVQYCADFCDRARVLHLPVGMGEVVWMISGGKLVEAKVIEVTVVDGEAMSGTSYTAASDDGYYYFCDKDIGDVVHLTREGAEAALAMRNNQKGAIQ